MEGFRFEKNMHKIDFISLHIRSMWETTVMHKQVSGWTVNFGPNFPESPFLELKTRKPPPPILENFRFGMTKVYSGIPPPFQKTSDLGWPKFTPEYPPPHFGKLQIWDDQSLLWNTPPFWKASDLGWPKFTPEYPPISESFRFGMTKVYSWIPPPHFGKLQIRDDQSLLRNTPPHFGKLQIWDDQSLLWNTPPNENCQRVQVRDFQNTESYYMWRLYPTRITTSFHHCVTLTM